MTRAKMASEAYWNRWIEFRESDIADCESIILLPSENKDYRPQFIFNLAIKYLELMICKYSRGDDLRELSAYFTPLLNAWEKSIVEGEEIFTEMQKISRREWAGNLDHYIICFWLVGLAIMLDVSAEVWSRLVILVANEGNDILLDRLIATRQVNRKIGKSLCHPKPYKSLLAVIDEGQTKQPGALLKFVENWYPSLSREAMGKLPAMYRHPYWYDFGTKNLEGGAFFGYWCFEAAAIAKAFGIDDSECHAQENYPGDMLHLNGPTTHLSPKDPIFAKARWYKKMFRF
jgi:hypothetical protein